MTKPHFVQDLGDSRRHGSSDLNKEYNHGLGHVHRNAVVYEDIYEELDSLPRTRGNKGRFGWDHDSGNFRYRLMSRWIKAQVGRPIDDIRSEVFRACKKDNLASRRMRDEMDDYLTRGQLKVATPARGHYGYAPRPSVCVVSADETHIIDHYVSVGDLYVDLDGILRKVGKEEYDALWAECKRVPRQRGSSCVQVVRGRNYFCLNGNWMELTLAKADLAPRGTGVYHYFGSGYADPNCLLFRKLGGSWANDHHHIFPHAGQYCKSMRSLSRKEIKAMLFDVDGPK